MILPKAKVATSAESPGQLHLPTGPEGQPSVRYLIAETYRRVRGDGDAADAFVKEPYLKEPFLARLPGVGRFATMLSAPWAKGMHETEVYRLSSGEFAQQRMAERFLEVLQELTGVPKSFLQARRGEITPTHEIFDPQNLELDDLIDGGIRIHTKKYPNVTCQKELIGNIRRATIKDLFALQVQKDIAMTGILESLLKFYPPQTTLQQIVDDLHKIHLKPIDSTLDKYAQGWPFQVTTLDGVTRQKENALEHIGRLYQPDQNLEIVSKEMVDVADAVYRAAQDAGGMVILPDEQTQAPWLVGTGLAGEIANSVVKTMFAGGGNVYLPDLTRSGSRLAAALVVKQLADEKAGRMGADVVDSVFVHGGVLLVDAVDGFNPGQVAAKIRRILPAGATAYYGAMMYAPGSGREILGEVAQHAVMEALATEGLIQGAFRLVSPTRPGKKVKDGESKNDVAAFQGPSYALAQLIKILSSDILGKKIPVLTPTGFMSGTKGLMVPLVQKLIPYAPLFDIYYAQDPKTTGSFLGLLFMALILVQQGKIDGEVLDDILKASFDGNIANSTRTMSDLLWRAAMLGYVSDAPRAQKMLGAHEPKFSMEPDENVRVRGPVLKLIEEIGEEKFKDVSNADPQTLERFDLSAHPQEGFPPFKFKASDDSWCYVRWLTRPEDFPGVIGERLKLVWENALGAIVVVNPKNDLYHIVMHHSVGQVAWSPYALALDIPITAPIGPEGGSWIIDIKQIRRVPFHGLGGNMAFPQVMPEPKDLKAWAGGGDYLLDWKNMPADQMADAILLGSLVKVAGKGMAMTTKYALVAEAYMRAFDLLSAEEGFRDLFREMTIDDVGLGGNKAITLRAADYESKIKALNILGRAAEITRAYISGPDEGVGKWKLRHLVGDEVQTFRQEKPVFLPNAANYAGDPKFFHMAGGTNGDSRVAGLGEKTSWATTSGVYEGMSVYFKKIMVPDDTRSKSIFIQGAGGTGIELIAALDLQRDAVAIADIDIGNLKVARALVKDLRPGPESDKPVFIFIKDAAKGYYKDKFDRTLREAQNEGFVIVENLPDAIWQAGRIKQKQIGILCPMANSHPITKDVIDVFSSVGGHAVFGSANNMLALDASGSYEPVGRYALEKGIFIPNDSAINMMGAATVIIDAMIGHAVSPGVMLNETEFARARERLVQKLIQVVGERVLEEYHEAFLKGKIPQAWRDRMAEAIHNDRVKRDVAVGGQFPERTVEAVTPPIIPGGGNGEAVDFVPAANDIPAESFSALSVPLMGATVFAGVPTVSAVPMII